MTVGFANAFLRPERDPRILVVLLGSSVVLPFLFVLVPLLPSATDVPVSKPTAREREDAAARTAFAHLAPSEKKDVVDFLALETGHLTTFQSSLVAWVLKRQDRDRGSWKPGEPAPFFDPLVHAPAQPTPRARLAETSSLSKGATAAIFSGIPPRRLVPGFVYDYGSQEIVRVRATDEMQRVFDNALAGYPPDLDLAEALVERELDDGAHQREALAFGYAYTDRSGNVYPGITLYDAYASRSEFEMPDVDVLGIVHTLFGDTNAWKAPIPSAEHAALYEKIGTAFVALHRHRSLRHALSMSYLTGSETLRDGYGGNLDNFHALWEDCSSNPEILRVRLPKSAQRDEFLEAWVKRCSQADSPFPKGLARKATLDSDAASVRACVLRVLGEYGALPTGAAHPNDERERPH